MNLSFSKELDVNYRSAYYHVYSLFANKSLLGKFYYSEKESLFSFDDVSVRIDTRHKPFRKSEVVFVDEISNKKIGHYKLTNWTIFVGYQDKVYLHDEIHSFKRQRPDGSSLFDKITLGRYKFTLTNNAEQITYTFQIRYPFFSFGNISTTLPFEGSIEFNSNNKMALFAGLYLIERALDNLSD